MSWSSRDGPESPLSGRFEPRAYVAVHLERSRARCGLSPKVDRRDVLEAIAARIRSAGKRGAEPPHSAPPDIPDDERARTSDRASSP